MRLGGFVWCLVLVSPAFGQIQSARTLVEEGNTLLAAGDFASALERYKSAEVTEPESPELAYNQGVAHYKLGEYDAARGAFNRALLTRDLALEAKAKFNLGDVAYASALEKQSNFQEAVDLLKTGIGQYRDALELDPEDEGARKNIEMAQVLIKDLLDKLKKQQEQEQQQQQDQQGEQDPQQQDDQEQQQDQDQGEQEGEQEQQQQKDEQEGDQEDKQQQSGDEQQEQQQQPQAGEEMTNGEAERMLQAVRDKEKRRREEQAERRRARYIRVPKDW